MYRWIEFSSLFFNNLLVTQSWRQKRRIVKNFVRRFFEILFKTGQSWPRRRNIKMNFVGFTLNRWVISTWAILHAAAVDDFKTAFKAIIIEEVTLISTFLLKIKTVVIAIVSIRKRMHFFACLALKYFLSPMGRPRLSDGSFEFQRLWNRFLEDVIIISWVIFCYYPESHFHTYFRNRNKRRKIRWHKKK